MPRGPANGGANGPPRGQWGDDGHDVYGEGIHRGSSSTGGGRGHAWQSDDTTDRPFYGPPGGFVEGASGPNHRQHGGYRGHHGRGGRYRQRHPPPPVVVEQMDATEAPDPGQTPDLSDHAMEVVTELATAVATASESVDNADKAESDRASKWARKKEKMLCYRCGEKGHFIADCVTELCDTCSKPAHGTGGVSYLA